MTILSGGVKTIINDGTEIFRQTQLSKETGIPRSTVREYLRDCNEFIEPHVSSIGILLHIKDMHTKGMTIEIIKELLSEKYPAQENVVVEAKKTKETSLQYRVPGGVISKREYDDLFAKVVELAQRVNDIEPVKQDNEHLRNSVKELQEKIEKHEEAILSALETRIKATEDAIKVWRETKAAKDKKTWWRFW